MVAVEAPLDLTEGLAAAEVSNAGKPARAPVDGENALALQDGDDDGGIRRFLLAFSVLLRLVVRLPWLRAAAAISPPLPWMTRSLLLKVRVLAISQWQPMTLIPTAMTR